MRSVALLDLERLDLSHGLTDHPLFERSDLLEPFLLNRGSLPHAISVAQLNLGLALSGQVRSDLELLVEVHLSLSGVDGDPDNLAILVEGYCSDGSINLSNWGSNLAVLVYYEVLGARNRSHVSKPDLRYRLLRRPADQDEECGGEQKNRYCFFHVSSSFPKCSLVLSILALCTIVNRGTTLAVGIAASPCARASCRKCQMQASLTGSHISPAHAGLI